MIDMIDISNAEVCGLDNPDPRNWPIASQITEVVLGGRFEAGDTMIRFDKALTAQDVIGSEGGPITWTLWGGFVIAGRPRVTAWVRCHRGHYIPTGPLMAPRQIAENIFYDGYLGGTTLGGYQPIPSEQMILFGASGDSRRVNIQAGEPWRTNVVTVPWTSGTYKFHTQAPSVPTPPVVSPVDPAPPAPVSGEVLDELRKQTQLLTSINKNIESLRGDIVRVDRSWTSRLNSAVPTLLGLFGSR